MGGIYNTVNMHCFHYAGNNPIKLTDPDGRFDRMGDYRIGELVKQYRKNNVDLPSSAWDLYNPQKRSGITIGPEPKYGEIHIGTNILLRIGDVLPTPNDLSFEDLADLPNGVEMTAFAASILEKAAQTAPDGSYVGTVKLWYEKNSKGECVKWGISLTLRNEKGQVVTSIYTKSEAMDLMKKLKESGTEKHQKIYEKIQKLFD